MEIQTKVKGESALLRKEKDGVREDTMLKKTDKDLSPDLGHYHRICPVAFL